MINIKITFFDNYGNEDEVRTKLYKDIDAFMCDYGFDYFKIHKGENYYNECKDLFLKGETLRWDDVGLKFDQQWYNEDDTIMSIEIL
jgi:hypothetical protein